MYCSQIVIIELFFVTAEGSTCCNGFGAGIWSRLSTIIIRRTVSGDGLIYLELKFRWYAMHCIIYYILLIMELKNCNLHLSQILFIKKILFQVFSFSLLKCTQNRLFQICLILLCMKYQSICCSLNNPFHQRNFI